MELEESHYDHSQFNYFSANLLHIAANNFTAVLPISLHPGSHLFSITLLSSSLILVILLPVFWDKVSLCSSDSRKLRQPQTHANIPALASCVLPCLIYHHFNNNHPSVHKKGYLFVVWICIPLVTDAAAHLIYLLTIYVSSLDKRLLWYSCTTHSHVFKPTAHARQVVYYWVKLPVSRWPFFLED